MRKHKNKSNVKTIDELSDEQLVDEENHNQRYWEAIDKVMDRTVKADVADVKKKHGKSFFNQHPFALLGLLLWFVLHCIVLCVGLS